MSTHEEERRSSAEIRADVERAAQRAWVSALLLVLIAVLFIFAIIAGWHLRVAGDVQDTQRMKITTAVDVCRESTDVTGCLGVVLELQEEQQ